MFYEIENGFGFDVQDFQYVTGWVVIENKGNAVLLNSFRPSKKDAIEAAELNEGLPWKTLSKSHRVCRQVLVEIHKHG